MTDIKLPPLPDDLIAHRMTETEVRSLLKRYGERCATAAIEADRQSRNCGQCVPLSTDGKSVFIDGVGEVLLDFSWQARSDLISAYQGKVRALESENYSLVSDLDDRQARDEPVAWYTDDHLTDKSATTWDRTVAARWRDKGWTVGELFAAPQPQQQVGDTPTQSITFGPIKVGNLPTANQDDYPDLGDWWVQLRIGPDNDEVLARVYGSTPQQAYERAVLLAKQQPQQIPDGYRLVPQGLISLCDQLTKWRNCMSYNDSYFGEPDGDLKRIAAAMERAMLEAAPEVKP